MTMENVNGANGANGANGSAGSASSVNSAALTSSTGSLEPGAEPHLPREHMQLPAPLSEQMSDAEAIHALTGLLSELRQDVDRAMSAEPPAQSQNQA